MNNKEYTDWDVKLDEKIEFFDREKTYELTHYRPIDMTNGLDFDITPFIQDALTKEKTGKYTEFRQGSKQYAEFWDERYRRCIEGYEVDGYRLTGDNYFWINFYRLISAKTGEEGFPSFTNVQYEWFHYVEMCEKLKLDCVALKPRGIGWSEMAASMGVCPYITLPSKTMFYTASSEDFVSAVLDKAWTQLDWLNLNTEGGFRKLRQAKNTQFHKRASKLTKDKTEFGWMSEIIGVVADNPKKVRGFRCHRLFYEEAGSNPVLQTSWVQGEALVTRVGRKAGTRFAWGTGGDSGPALAGLESLFTQPGTFGVLPYRHNFTPNKEYVLTGFFIPAYRMHFDMLDDRGVTDEVAAKEMFEASREAKRTNPKAYLEYASEYCFTPDDALIRQGENQFNQALLAEQLSQIMIHKTVKEPTRGFLMGGNKDGDRVNPIVFRPDMKGDTLVLEEPEKDENGQVMRNLYCAGIDSIDVGKNDSTGQGDVSDFCIVIKKRVHGLKEPKYVAMYKGRPDDIRQAYSNALRMMEWYNCKCVVETTRTNIITYAREKKKIHLFMTRPRATISNLKTNTTMIGTPVPETVIRHYLEKIEEFVNDYAHTIGFVEIINQLLKYDYEMKRKYDIIAAMGMCELADEELYSAPIRPINEYKTEWRDIGYFRDATGRMHYGSIPTKEELSTYHLR